MPTDDVWSVTADGRLECVEPDGCHLSLPLVGMTARDIASLRAALARPEPAGDEDRLSVAVEIQNRVPDSTRAFGFDAHSWIAESYLDEVIRLRAALRDAVPDAVRRWREVPGLYPKDVVRILRDYVSLKPMHPAERYAYHTAADVLEALAAEPITDGEG